MPKIEVSFKKTTRDMRLFTRAHGEEEKSDFIKKAIEHYSNFLESSGETISWKL